MKIDLKLDSIKIYNNKLSAFLLPDQIDILEKEIKKIVERQISDTKSSILRNRIDVINLLCKTIDRNLIQKYSFEDYKTFDIETTLKPINKKYKFLWCGRFTITNDESYEILLHILNRGQILKN